MKITRHYVKADDLTLHYRRAGAGPPVVLLHESPRSSVALLPLMERLADKFTVIGFDTPGFGASDPLPMIRPTAADYADLFATAIANLGIERAPLYGTHTGAVIALELARNHPDMVSIAILDGYPVFDRDERENILRQYLPRFAPAWHGGHVAELWARVRDQYSFFPWYLAGQSGRLPGDPPPLAHHQSVVLDYLRSGNNYVAGYASAFRFDGYDAVQGVRCPVAYLAREDDLLFPHLDRLPALPDGSFVKRLSKDRDQWGATIADIMQGHPGQAAVADHAKPSRPSEAGVIERQFLNFSRGSVRVFSTGGGGARPVLLLHRVPGHGAGYSGLMRHIGKTRPVLAIDLPGAGESTGWDDFPTRLDDQADRLAEIVTALGLEEIDLLGDFTGGPLAAALSTQAKLRVQSVVAIEAPPNDPAVLGAWRDAYVPDLAPQWDGRHLSAAWWWARDGLLYHPWFARRRAHARQLEIDPNVDRVHDTFVAALLGAGVNNALSLAAFERPISLVAPHRSVRHVGLSDAPVADPRADRTVPPDERSLAAAILGLLDEA